MPNYAGVGVSFEGVDDAGFEGALEAIAIAFEGRGARGGGGLRRPWFLVVHVGDMTMVRGFGSVGGRSSGYGWLSFDSCNECHP
jgi:hypothetical protein